MIQDSGSRRNFDSGAVRDIDENKGRCDLLPLGVISYIVKDPVLACLHEFLFTGNQLALHDALSHFLDTSSEYKDFYEMFLDVSIHYAEGSAKYGERNWERGINVHSFIDSATRHYFKHKLKYTDERHDRAFVWNILGALYTTGTMPELVDIPAKKPEWFKSVDLDTIADYRYLSYPCRSDMGEKSLSDED